MTKKNDNDIVLGILSYLGLLVLIPLLIKKKSDFVRFHTQQGLALLIVGIGFGLVSGIIPVVGGVIWYIGSIFLLVLTVMGIINVAKNKKKPLPIIGGLGEKLRI